MKNIGIIRLASVVAMIMLSCIQNILAQQPAPKQRPEPGQQAPPFVQADTAGKLVALEDFRGKYVLLDFWASWCGPCREGHPDLVSAYKTFSGRNFTIIGISLDKDREKWIRAITEDGLLWTQLSDLKYWKNEIALQYGVIGIPVNYLIGPDGNILAKNIHGHELVSKLSKLL